MTTTTTAPPLERVLCLLFRAGRERIAIRASDVQKVTPPGHLSKLPCLPSPLLGITQHRGRVLTVVDGVALLASGAATASVESRLLILEKPVRHLGLLVDGVDEIESLRLPADVDEKISYLKP
jgi:purine-binding chemotaxis protein CheW